MKNSPEQLSVQIVEEYYRNDLSLFFNSIDDKFIWIGPATNQYIEGKQTLIDAFSQENNTLLFSIAQMSSKLIPAGNNTCEVLLKYVVYTYYPSNYIAMHNQRLTLFWKKTKDNNLLVWKCLLMHVSNAMEIDSRDNIYPIHLDELAQYQLHTQFKLLEEHQEDRLIAKGEDYSTYYIAQADIEYICAGKGKFSDIYTKNGIIRVRLLIEQLYAKLYHQFYRPHRSYIINVLEIANISNNQIFLKNGANVPIPPKKKTQVMADIANILENF